MNEAETRADHIDHALAVANEAVSAQTHPHAGRL